MVAVRTWWYKGPSDREVFLRDIPNAAVLLLFSRPNNRESEFAPETASWNRLKRRVLPTGIYPLLKNPFCFPQGENRKFMVLFPEAVYSCVRFVIAKGWSVIHPITRYFLLYALHKIFDLLFKQFPVGIFMILAGIGVASALLTDSF